MQAMLCWFADYREAIATSFGVQNQNATVRKWTSALRHKNQIPYFDHEAANPKELDRDSRPQPEAAAQHSATAQALGNEAEVRI
jgi:hypothetical protein